MKRYTTYAWGIVTNHGPTRQALEEKLKRIGTTEPEVSPCHFHGDDVQIINLTQFATVVEMVNERRAKGYKFLCFYHEYRPGCRWELWGAHGEIPNTLPLKSQRKLFLQPPQPGFA